MKPDSCVGCACQPHGRDFSSVEGTGANGVLIVGEASGESEQRDQLPFRPYAAAGGVLERAFRRMSLSRASFSITNVLRCRPRNNWLEKAPWEYSATQQCRPNLAQVIRERRPRAILALGNIPTRELTGVAGEKLGVGYLAGYVLPLQPDLEWNAEGRTPVVVSFHPSFLRHGKMAYFGQFCRTLRRAVGVAAGTDRDWQWVDPETPPKELHYVDRPGVDRAESFLRRVESNPSLVLSYDIETAESVSLDEDAREGFADTEVRLIQFAVGDGVEARESIALDWDGPYKAIASRILRSPNPKCGHNVWLFDNRVLRAAGQREGLDLIPRGEVHDTLAMFHHWQPDLPAHLQFAAQFINFPFPWKHLAATDISFYGCCDVDATLRLYLFLRDALSRENLWDGYRSQVHEVRPVLAAMEDRGLPIDDAARLALDADFTAAQGTLGDEIRGLAPVAACRVHPAAGYKGIPPEVKAWAKGRGLDADALPADWYDGLTAFRFRESASGEDPGEWYRYERRAFEVAEVDEVSGEPVTKLGTARWCRVYDFNPNSRPQVIAYMKAKGHKVPKDVHREDAEGNAPETTNEKELRRLANRTGDTFYLKVIEYRGFTKLRGTYIDGFAPAADGCVHTTFTFDTAIAQLSSRNPNVQNFTKLKPTPQLAKAMRGMVAAKEGKVLTEWDLKSCHVLTLGFLAEDANWMRLARLDMHSFVAGHFLGLWNALDILHESDAELLARFKQLKANPAWKLVRDDQAKHGILGIGNGLQAKGLFERYMEQFQARACPACQGTRQVAGVRGPKRCMTCGGTGLQSGMAIAAEVLNVARLIGPKVFAWQERVQRQAHDDRCLRSPFGHMRRFYEVYRWDAKKMAWGHGDQAEEAIAYLLSNVAHAHMREIMKKIDRAGLAKKYGMCNQIHDALMFHFDEGLLDEHVADIYPIMTHASEVLKNQTAPDGLWIDCEASVGKRWSEMKAITTPKREEVRDGATQLHAV